MVIIWFLIIYCILNNNKLDDDNFDDYDYKTVIHVRLMAWCNRCKKKQSMKNKNNKKQSQFD